MSSGKLVIHLVIILFFVNTSLIDGLEKDSEAKRKLVQSIENTQKARTYRFAGRMTAEIHGKERIKQTSEFKGAYVSPDHCYMNFTTAGQKIEVYVQGKNILAKTTTPDGWIPVPSLELSLSSADQLQLEIYKECIKDAKISGEEKIGQKDCVIVNASMNLQSITRIMNEQLWLPESVKLIFEEMEIKAWCDKKNSFLVRTYASGKVLTEIKNKGTLQKTVTRLKVYITYSDYNEGISLKLPDVVRQVCAQGELLIIRLEHCPPADKCQEIKYDKNEDPIKACLLENHWRIKIPKFDATAMEFNYAEVKKKDLMTVLFLEGGPVKNDRLTPSDRQVVIKNHTGAPYKLIQEVMASCGRAGFWKIELATSSRNSSEDSSVVEMKLTAKLQGKIENLVKQLSHNDEQIRQEAVKELITIGQQVIPFLENTRKYGTPGVQKYADSILKKVRRRIELPKGVYYDKFAKEVRVKILNDKPGQENRKIEVTVVSNQGLEEIAVSDCDVLAEKLEPIFRHFEARGEDARLLIAPDDTIPFNDIIRVFDACCRAGADDVHFASNTPVKSPYELIREETK